MDYLHDGLVTAKYTVMRLRNEAVVRSRQMRTAYRCPVVTACPRAFGAQTSNYALSHDQSVPMRVCTVLTFVGADGETTLRAVPGSFVPVRRQGEACTRDAHLTNRRVARPTPYPLS